MIARVFQMPDILVLVLISVAAFLVAMIIAATQEKAHAPCCAAARAPRWRWSVACWHACSSADSYRSPRTRPGERWPIGWGFFLWPGAIDTVPWLLGKSVFTTPGSLLWIAGIVGACNRAMNGFWRIHRWKGLGWLSFPLDVTWGLPVPPTGRCCI